MANVCGSDEHELLASDSMLTARIIPNVGELTVLLNAIGGSAISVPALPTNEEDQP